MDSREAFEATCAQHAKDAGYEGHERLARDADGGYVDPHTQAAWWGWQAAIEYCGSQKQADAMLKEREK